MCCIIKFWQSSPLLLVWIKTRSVSRRDLHLNRLQNAERKFSFQLLQLISVTERQVGNEREERDFGNFFSSHHIMWSRWMDHGGGSCAEHKVKWILAESNII
jgi:hypothetical protein